MAWVGVGCGGGRRDGQMEQRRGDAIECDRYALKRSGRKSRGLAGGAEPISENTDDGVSCCRAS